MQATRVNELSPLELAAWRGLLRVHAALVARARPRARGDARPPAHALRGAPLPRVGARPAAADEPSSPSSVLLSQSGLTRLVDRLERAGLVDREPCPDDRRGLLADHAGRAATPRGGAADASRRRARRFLARFDERRARRAGRERGSASGRASPTESGRTTVARPAACNRLRRVKIGIVVPFSWSFWGAVVEHAELQAEALEARGHEVRLVMGNDPPGQFTRVLHPRVGPPRRPAGERDPDRALGDRPRERLAAEHRPQPAGVPSASGACSSASGSTSSTSTSR